MTTESTIAFIDATAETLKLEIRPEWKPNVVIFFEVARTMAALIEETGAPFRSESAPVFQPRDVE
jgi:hypothetical protein